MAYRSSSQRHAPPSPTQIDLFLEVGRRLDAKGWVAANDGNLSVRESDGTFLVTASGAPKGYLRRDQILRVDSEGKVLSGEGRPSSELGLHLTIYRERPDVSAVVHAHPPVSTAYAVAREPLDACVLPELVLTLGRIPIAPYATPGTPELGASIVDLGQVALQLDDLLLHILLNPVCDFDVAAMNDEIHGLAPFWCIEPIVRQCQKCGTGRAVKWEMPALRAGWRARRYSR